MKNFLVKFTHYEGRKITKYKKNFNKSLCFTTFIVDSHQKTSVNALVFYLYEGI